MVLVVVKSYKFGKGKEISKHDTNNNVVKDKCMDDFFLYWIVKNHNGDVKHDGSN